MDAQDYLAVRKAYNLVRQETPSKVRLAFEEAAILAHLAGADPAPKTSDLAKHQGVLRPTMTHRTNHLAALGYIEREEGTVDHRNVICNISYEGRKKLDEIARDTRAHLGEGKALNHLPEERIIKYFDAMGTGSFSAADLVLLCLSTCRADSLSIGGIVRELSLLQPTVSMAVVNLERDGFLKRGEHSEGRAFSQIMLTEEGKAEAKRVIARAEEIVVRRSRTK